ncbi:DUF3644 domain-containing protein [Pantoea sp. USHLN256]|uniref:DUF3644 domain-containing protein n=1 Tax=Pantoea sp. USHLN256 TaxID=3081293 RepID=UPI0030162DC3
METIHNISGFNKNEKIEKAFHFFSEMKSTKKHFTVAEVTKRTGWGKSTVQTYLTKKWSTFIIRDNDGLFVSAKFENFSLTSFIKHHSQNENIPRSFYENILEKSISACITAIEVYNKPDFKFREESFSILMINAWELILKARILSLNGDVKDSIYLKSKGAVETTESGSPKTISISKAINILSANGNIKNIVVDNIKLLIEIRDHSVHFIHDDMSLSTKIQCIGTASLKNYMTLAMEWFDYDFRKYNFFLMPVSLYHLSDIESFSVSNNSAENLKSYLDKMEESHKDDNDPNFSISLRLSTKLIKTSSDESIEFMMTNNPKATSITFTEEDILKRYPLTYDALTNKLGIRYSDFLRNSKFFELLRQVKSEGEKYCRERRLDPSNPNSVFKLFYSEATFTFMDAHYKKV